MYNAKLQHIPSYLLMKEHENENQNIKNIDDSFYEGFGIS